MVQEADFREPRQHLIPQTSVNCWPEKANCDTTDRNRRRLAFGPGEPVEFAGQPKPAPRKIQVRGRIASHGVRPKLYNQGPIAKAEQGRYPDMQTGPFSGKLGKPKPDAGNVTD